MATEKSNSLGKAVSNNPIIATLIAAVLGFGGAKTYESWNQPKVDKAETSSDIRLANEKLSTLQNSVDTLTRKFDTYIDKNDENIDDIRQRVTTLEVRLGTLEKEKTHN